MRIYVHLFEFALLIASCGLAHATTATNCVSPLTGLVAWWPGDGHAKDYAGSHGGQLVSGTRFAAGKVGSAFRFDGTDDRVLVNDSPDLQFTNSFTIEAWIFISGLPTFAPHAMICFRGDDRSGLDPYYLSVQPNGLLAFHMESTVAPEHLEGPVPAGTWVHVAATLENETGAMRIYVNANLVAETMTSVRPLAELDPQAAAGLGIGNHPGIPNVSHNMPFNGLIDELRFYSRALTPSEIRAIVDAGSKGMCKAVMNIRLYPGVTLDAPVGTVARIEYLDAFGANNEWLPLTNITVQSTPYLFIDTHAATLNQRLYRAVLSQ